MFAKILELLNLLDSPAKKLPLNGKSFIEYKVFLIKQRADVYRQLHDNFKNKINYPSKEELIQKMDEITALLEPVYELQLKRQRTFFPLI